MTVVYLSDLNDIANMSLHTSFHYLCTHVINVSFDVFRLNNLRYIIVFHYMDSYWLLLYSTHTIGYTPWLTCLFLN